MSPEIVARTTREAPHLFPGRQKPEFLPQCVDGRIYRGAGNK